MTPEKGTDIGPHDAYRPNPPLQWRSALESPFFGVEMTRPRTVTHAYRMPGGWEELPHRPLTSDTAQALRDEGFTLVRARRGWGNSKELSLSLYIQQPSSAAPWSEADIRPSGSSAA